jgi:hypothetical protein
MAKEYARLDLLQEVSTNSGSKAKEIIIYRPTAKDLSNLFEAPTIKARLERFIGTNVRAINGADTPEEFKAAELSSPDVLEVIDLIGSFSREADGAPTSDDVGGDGITGPIVYNLLHEIRLSEGEDAQVIRQIQFEAKRLGELSEFLDSSGEAQEFRVFMRLFGTLLGTRLPMSDSIINAIDFTDYYTIRKKIMGKLVTSQNRWKRTST